MAGKMNFKELMSRASANNMNASHQLRRSGHQHRDQTPGVSSSAVKSFLEKKERERKKQQAEQAAARQARIQARLEQNLKVDQAKKGKNENAPKSSFLNPPYAQEKEAQITRPANQPKQDRVDHHRKGKTLNASSSKTTAYSKNKDVSRKPPTSDVKLKNNEKLLKEKSGRNNDFVANGKKNETLIRKKKMKAAPAPPNFKELLAIAEQNKSGLNKVRKKTEKVTIRKEDKNDVRVEESKARRREKPNAEHKITPVDEKNVQIKSKNKEKPKVKTKEKQGEIQRKTAVERDASKGVPSKGLVNVHESSKSLKRTREPDFIAKNVVPNKYQRPAGYNSRPLEAQARMYKQNHYPNSRSYYEGHYEDVEEEDSDLDGFIDDEDYEGQTDVSRHIKDIFGYDRRRYAPMDDFDDAAMESSYGQIEREEKRSSKIAKLEDEIEILKEQAELKRMRDQLRKSKKLKKK